MRVSERTAIKQRSPNVLSVGDVVEQRINRSRFRMEVVMVMPWLRLVRLDGHGRWETRPDGYADTWDPHPWSRPAHRIYAPDGRRLA